MEDTDTTWNYRLATRVVDGERRFEIRECYYRGGQLDSYSEKTEFYDWEDLPDVKATHELIGRAFEKTNCRPG